MITFVRIWRPLDRAVASRRPTRISSGLCGVVRTLCQMIANSVSHYLAHGVAESYTLL